MHNNRAIAAQYATLAMSASTSSPQYKTSRHFRLRLLRDRLARRAVAAGGIGVIVAILLIFLYLVYVVLPLLEAPEMEPVASYTLPGSAPVLYLAMDEQAEVGAVFDADGGRGAAGSDRAAAISEARARASAAG